MLDWTLFAAVAVFNRMWYTVPLIFSVSLVYAASRHESTHLILRHALRFGQWVVVFLIIIFVVLFFWSRNL